jgi:hypothetical protein
VLSYARECADRCGQVWIPSWQGGATHIVFWIRHCPCTPLVGMAKSGNVMTITSNLHGDTIVCTRICGDGLTMHQVSVV